MKTDKNMFTNYLQFVVIITPLVNFRADVMDPVYVGRTLQKFKLIAYFFKRVDEVFTCWRCGVSQILITDEKGL